MAVNELMRNNTTRYCVYFIDGQSDINFLPTSKECGKGEFSYLTTCSRGSIAMDATGQKYILDGNDEWIPLSKSSNIGELFAIDEDELEKLLK